MKKVLLVSVLLENQPRPQTIVFDNWEVFQCFKECHDIVQCTIQSVEYHV